MVVPLLVADELVDLIYETKHLEVIMNSSMNFKSQVAKVIQEVKKKSS